MDIEELTVREWADALPSDGVEVFHTPAALRVMDEHTRGRLRLLGGFRGRELVGFFPVFVRSYPGVDLVLSPPPAVSASRMGPVVMPASPKRSKQERLYDRFTEAVVREIFAGRKVTVMYTILSPAFYDPRPFQRAGFDFEPRFTYCLDLRETDPDEVLSRFSSSLRSEVRKLENGPVDVTVGGAEAAVRVYDDYRERFAEQGSKLPTPRAYTRDLVASLDDRARVYTATDPDGEFLGGITVLYSDTTAYFWQGGMRATYDGLSVNSLLHWRIVGDVLTDPALDSVSRYDLGRGTVERLGRYKSKFGADLVPYYELKSSKLVALAKEVHARVAY